MHSAPTQTELENLPWWAKLGSDHKYRHLQPVCDPELVDTVMRRCGPFVVAWACDIGAQAAARITLQNGVFSEHEARLRRNIEAVTLSAVLTLSDHAESVPPVTEDSADNIRICARSGVTIDEMLGAIRLGHRCLSEAFLAACDHHAPVADRAFILREVSTQLFTVIDQLAQTASQIYSFERTCMLASPAQARGAIIRGFIDGGDQPGLATHSAGELETALNYKLRQHHQAIVVTPTAGTCLSIDELRRTSFEVARATQTSDYLVHLEADQSWIWLGGDSRRHHIVAAPPDGLALSIGSPQYGLNGFRSSLRQACDVRDLRSRASKPPAVWWYRDVEVALLLSSDMERAKSFVAERLNGLLGTDPAMTELRRTLKVYLDAHASPNEAARRLHLARNTVAARVNKAAACLGREITSDTADLHAALVLAETLGDSLLAEG